MLVLTSLLPIEAIIYKPAPIVTTAVVARTTCFVDCVVPIFLILVLSVSGGSSPYSLTLISVFAIYISEHKLVQQETASVNVNIYICDLYLRTQADIAAARGRCFCFFL